MRTKLEHEYTSAHAGVNGDLVLFTKQLKTMYDWLVEYENESAKKGLDCSTSFVKERVLDTVNSLLMIVGDDFLNVVFWENEPVCQTSKK